MKKLLMKWFPNYFHVCQHTEVKFEDLPHDRSLNVVVVDDEAEMINRALGIADERADELAREAKACFFKHNKFTNCMEELSTKCNHANELVWAIMIAYDQKTGGGNPLGGILGAIITGGGKPPQ